VGVKEAPDGLDFFYGSRSHALKLLDFLSAVVAVRSRADKQLVSADHSSNLYTYKHTFCVEIVPLCKEDLVCLPRKVYSALGALGPILLCVRVSNQLTLLDPVTLRTAAVDATAYWRCPYRPVLSAKQLCEFVVLDIEATGPPVGRYTPAEASVVRARDWGGGRGDAVLFARTHLGALLKPGDVALGYDVAGATLAGAEMEEYRGLQLPDVVLVRKSYAERRKARRERQGAHSSMPGAPGGRGTARRAWKLRRLTVAPADTEAAGARRAAAAAAAGEDDEEAFLEELEEDPELRARVALYRDRNAPLPQPRGRDAMDDGEGGSDDDDDFPEVPLEELLEEMSLGGAPSDMDDVEEDEE
jgi:nonsense-mediated mRNA decay protein 3